MVQKSILNTSLPAFHLFKLKVEILRSELKNSIKYFETFSDQYGLFLLHFISPVGRSEVDGASSSDVRGPGFEQRPICYKKYPFFTPKP